MQLNFCMKLINQSHESEFLANKPMLANLLPDDWLLLEHLKTNMEATTTFLF